MSIWDIFLFFLCNAITSPIFFMVCLFSVIGGIKSLPGAFGTCLQHLGNFGGNEHMVKDVYMRRGT